MKDSKKSKPFCIDDVDEFVRRRVKEILAAEKASDLAKANPGSEHDLSAIFDIPFDSVDAFAVCLRKVLDKDPGISYEGSGISVEYFIPHLSRMHSGVAEHYIAYRVTALESRLSYFAYIKVDSVPSGSLPAFKSAVLNDLEVILGKDYIIDSESSATRKIFYPIEFTDEDHSARVLQVAAENKHKRRKGSISDAIGIYKSLNC